MPNFFQALFSGGLAGLSVELALYPLDTIKTRVQCESGFKQSGGFKGVYSGVSATVAAFPSTSLFFITYETTKHVLEHRINEFLIPVIAGCIGELSACLIRVPIDILKQRTQVGMSPNNLSVLKTLIRHEGISGLYAGYLSTIFRESLDNGINLRNTERYALYGSIAGGLSAFVTTPFDVIKTRIMLSSKDSYLRKKGAIFGFKHVLRHEGLAILFKGALPRTCWISLGGFIFFGVYESSNALLKS
ncbi:S-adenosylmethionine mitochondrial carrier protein [Rozella allomycis CSF55]|uniref:S-adenosylmethionine mitochondrial carrier protein n=1 Tax=Rozella allomycis (strain CSF55) TaxID=988480 RepID=A0A4P9YIV5_ROZAC|nr:S-adenosylmethionine mitochondrial carrier protein [Rozella allomycis CSF55]